ncbi:MAG: DASS family sodium-coupled anion symporter [Schleiferiaceae bacterium]|nr:DASS family sodium-coupled anion symporter [Schleiferiaceae bacterium]
MSTNVTHALRFWIGPFLFLLALCLPLSGPKALVIGGAAWMLSWWLTEIIHLGATALLPLLLFGGTGLLDQSTLAMAYAHPLIFLFMGGFFLAKAMEHQGLHSLLAKRILALSGSQPRQALAGSMLATWLLSMWMSNTATAVMMLPLTLSLVKQLKGSDLLERRILLGLAWAANLGGMATLIGTPPNVLFAAFLEDSTGVVMDFWTWSSMAIPVSVILMLAAYVQLQVGLSMASSEALPKPNKQPWTTGQRRMAFVFFLTAMAWMTRSWVASMIALPHYSDTWIVITASLVMFSLPAGKRQGPLLPWSIAKDIEWGILLLFGGGLALASGLKASGLLDVMGGVSSQMEIILWIGVAAAAGVWLTELFSNMALVSAMLPIALALSLAKGIPFEAVAIPLTMGASCAFMLPVATPPNALVFATGKLKILHMVQHGVWMNIFATLVIWAVCALSFV